MSKKKAAQQNVFLQNINVHLAFIAITLCAGIAAGAIYYQSRAYSNALSIMDHAVLGAMTESSSSR